MNMKRMNSISILNGLQIKYFYTLKKVFLKKLNICVLILSDKYIGQVLSKVIAIKIFIQHPK